MNPMASQRSDRALTLLLRLLGTSSLTAVFFVAVPREWMSSIHAALGLGVMPGSPVVWYLARSLSAFYALLGGLFWVVSFDLERHRRVVGYLGVAVPLFGVALFAIDYCEGLPPFWTYWEGPFVVAFGIAIWRLNRAGRASAG